MAETTIIIDDLDGSPAARQTTFSLDNDVWTIDLSEANRQALESALKPFVEKARKARSAGPGGTPRRSAVAQDMAPVRAWANENGFEVSSRGRMPKAVLEAYNSQA